MKAQGKRGFTLIELIVAMTILIIAFGLITYLYTRAARIRKVVVINSEIQQALSQIMDTLTYGEKGEWGLVHATEFISGSDNSFTAKRGTDLMTASITDDEGEGSIQIDWNGNIYQLDPAKKIMLNSSLTEEPVIPLSRFEYFNFKGNPVTTNYADTSFVKITLWAVSTDPSLKDAPPVVLTTGVRLRNKMSF